MITLQAVQTTKRFLVARLVLSGCKVVRLYTQSHDGILPVVHIPAPFYNQARTLISQMPGNGPVDVCSS